MLMFRNVYKKRLVCYHLGLFVGVADLCPQLENLAARAYLFTLHKALTTQARKVYT